MSDDNKALDKPKKGFLNSLLNADSNFVDILMALAISSACICAITILLFGTIGFVAFIIKYLFFS